MAKANAYDAQERIGLSGIIRRRAIAMAMAAKILCSEIVQRAFQASALVSDTPIAMPSKTEWKHKAVIRRIVSPNELAVARLALAKWCVVSLACSASKILLLRRRPVHLSHRIDFG